jgi:DNA invertase Pin-like site-specific DNA recombinase
MAVYGFLRVSTLTQAKEGESLDTQRHQVVSYASKGLALPEEKAKDVFHGCEMDAEKIENIKCFV